MPTLNAKPTTVKERIRNLDVLRGFALLGILIPNILLFALPETAFANPLVMGEVSSSDLVAYYILHVFAEGKFVSIFSILFGVGVYIFYERLDQKGVSARKYHRRRMFFLLLFGLVHAYLIWFGDILVSYAIIGLLAASMRRMRNSWKIVLIVIGLFVPMLLYYMSGFSFQFMTPEMVEMQVKEFHPPLEAVMKEIDLYQNGSWLDIFERRLELNVKYELGGFFLYLIWRVTALMLIGMMLFQRGIIQGYQSKTFYAIMALLGIGIGSILCNLGAFENMERQWELVYLMMQGFQYNFLGAIFTAIGYLGLINLILKLKILDFLMKGFEAVGRMAFTNYLCQSVICSLIFYSYGFGLFGQVARFDLFYFVAGIWIFQMTASYYWLKYYRMGPLEWLWRYLTYKQKPAFKIEK